MQKLKFATKVLNAATLAVQLKTKVEARVRHRATARALHLRQVQEVEKSLVKALTPLFQEQVRTAVVRLRDLEGPTLEKGGPGSGPRPGHGRDQSEGSDRTIKTKGDVDAVLIHLGLANLKYDDVADLAGAVREIDLATI